MEEVDIENNEFLQNCVISKMAAGGKKVAPSRIFHIFSFSFPKITVHEEITIFMIAIIFILLEISVCINKLT